MTGGLAYWLAFVVAAILALFAAIMVITRRNPIHAAVFLIVNFLAVAILYLLLSFQFIAIIQVLVYAGAIMMLVVFVIMLLSAEDEGKKKKIVIPTATAIGLLLVVILLVQLVAAVAVNSLPGVEGEYSVERLADMGDVKAIAELLFTKYLFPFEVASIILLVGIIGAVILSKKER